MSWWNVRDEGGRVEEWKNGGMRRGMGVRKEDGGTGWDGLGWERKGREGLRCV